MRNKIQFQKTKKSVPYQNDLPLYSLFKLIYLQKIWQFGSNIFQMKKTWPTSVSF